MYHLAHEIHSSTRSVITTTTTKIFIPTETQARVTLLTQQKNWQEDLNTKIVRYGHVCVGRLFESKTGKLLGVDPGDIKLLAEFSKYTLVEGDGSARFSVKAPEAWEPVIPLCSNIVIYVLGLDCFGKRANSQSVHRIDKFLELTGLYENEIIESSALARLVTNPEGGLKNVPATSDFYIALNKSDLLPDLHIAIDLGTRIVAEGNGRINSVVVTGKYGSERRSFVIN